MYLPGAPIGRWESRHCPPPDAVTRFLFAILVFLCSAGQSWAGSTVQDYQQDLINRATQSRLADEREWHLLLHYKANLLGSIISEEDDEGFFLSSRGKSDPQAELEATIRQFFSSDLVGRSKQPAQCAFIARYRWLKERLQFDEQRLIPQSCERFDRWRAELNPQGVSLIFPAAFLNNPASMFGHTFLRIDQHGQTEQTRLLAYTIDYAADVPAGAGLEFAFKGMFGGYKGFFSTPPYYLKVQAYRDIENRDMWEYRLNLTAAQIDRLLMHAWEMGNAYFDYFFFKENCSYHILSLLEYANPALRLRDQFHIWTIPADTVRVLVDYPGLVGGAIYRPSRSTIIKRKRTLLTADELELLQRIKEEPEFSGDPVFAAQPLSRRALILDLVSDYLRYKSESDNPDMTIYKERNRRVLTARSALSIPSEAIAIPPYTKQPDSGHRTTRMSIGGGWRNDDTFEEASFRALYHDLLDPEQGYTPDAQIEALGLTVRHYNRAEQTRIERATLLNILSLSPVDDLFRAPSWKVNVGMQTIRHRGCRLCNNGVFNGGIGGAIETAFIKREVLFAFAEAEANVSPAYHEYHRIGGGATVGIWADVTDRWKLTGSGSYLRYPLGDTSDDIRWHVGSRYTLARDWAARMEYTHRDRDDDFVFSLQAFF
ncbi:MAG: DUF4105 domain-containing protein [Nitrospira sp.]|nr:DUF4105 domain-containing protein [Nitrospira sp.]